MTVGSTWSGTYDYTAQALHRPQTMDELRHLVARTPRIRALGSRHSFTGLADSHELVSLDRLDPGLEIDAESETVTVSGGVRYGELGRALQREGWALRNLASLPHLSVAGAIATGTHGSGDRNGTLSRAVSGLEMVTADGDLISVSPVDSRFDGAVVSLGALGIVTRVTLDIEPTYDVRQDVFDGLSWGALLDNFDSIAARAYSVSIFTGWTGDTVGTVVMKSRTDAAAPPKALYGRPPLAADVHPIPEATAEAVTPQGGVPGPWIDRLPHFRLDFEPSFGEELQSEYLVPRRHAVSAIEAVRALGVTLAPHLHISELRTVAADSLWLSGAYETDVLGIHFTFRREPDAVAALLPVIEEALAPFDARPHWGKAFHSVQRDLYPRLDDFVALATELDPQGKFRNEFLDRYVF